MGPPGKRLRPARSCILTPYLIRATRPTGSTGKNFMEAMERAIRRVWRSTRDAVDPESPARNIRWMIRHACERGPHFTSRYPRRIDHEKAFRNHPRAWSWRGSLTGSTAHKAPGYRGIGGRRHTFTMKGQRGASRSPLKARATRRISRMRSEALHRPAHRKNHDDSRRGDVLIDFERLLIRVRGKAPRLRSIHSLWRHAVLNTGDAACSFRVTEGIIPAARIRHRQHDADRRQHRLESCVDPLTCRETAAGGDRLRPQAPGRQAVSAVRHHPQHIDHFGARRRCWCRDLCPGRRSNEKFR